MVDGWWMMNRGWMDGGWTVDKCIWGLDEEIDEWVRRWLGRWMHEWVGGWVDA